jgi:hypothetical protein
MERNEIVLEIERKLEHVKARPTRMCINTIHILLKQLNIRDIPKMSEYCEMSIFDAEAYCKDIQCLLHRGDVVNESPKDRKTLTYVFNETSLLPKVYEDTPDVFSETSSEETSSEGTELLSDKEDYDGGGYEVYESGNDEEFSD